MREKGSRCKGRVGVKEDRAPIESPECSICLGVEAQRGRSRKKWRWKGAKGWRRVRGKQDIGASIEHVKEAWGRRVFSWQ